MAFISVQRMWGIVNNSFFKLPVRHPPGNVIELEHLCSRYMVAMKRAKDALRVDGWGSEALFEADAEMAAIVRRLNEILGAIDSR